MTKLEMKKKAVELRKQGYSYNLIRKKVPVAKSTLSEWLRKISYTPNKEVRNRIRGGQIKSREWHQRRKEQSFKKAKKEAGQMVNFFSKRDLLMFGLGLYVGEGTKTHGHIRIINSDPEVINTAIRWFEDIFNLTTKNFHIDIHLYPDNNIQKSLHFWSKSTGIPLSQFGKTQVDKRKKKKIKRGLLRYGTAHLRIKACGSSKHGVFLFRKILALIDEVNKQIN